MPKPKTKPKTKPKRKRPGKYYEFDYKGVRIDPYRILLQYKITHPAHQHALKKLLRAGRSIKSKLTDIDEVIASLQRWKQMIKEDATAPKRKRIRKPL